MRQTFCFAFLLCLSTLWPVCAYPDGSIFDGAATDEKQQGPLRSRVTYYYDGDIIDSDTVWQGAVVVDGVLFVPETVTLTIRPGTVVSFTRSDAQYRESGTSEAVIPGSGIRVEGRLVAMGNPDAPIFFTSADESPEPGAWGCVFFDHSKGSVLRNCVLEYSIYTLHAHFSSLDVSRSVLTKNVDGSRFGFSKVTIEHCDITGNTGKGLNFANCRNTVRYCNITGNYEGIFLNEHDAKCVIEENNIHSNTRFDLSLGEFHDEDIITGVNWWGALDAEAVAGKVYDKADDPEIGEAGLTLAMREIPNAGASGLGVSLRWRFETGGFVDSSPAVDGGRVYFGSWDHNLYCLDAETGEQIWKFETGDCVDSSPAVYNGKVYFGSWDSNIYCLDAQTGKEVWRFAMEQSNFDDHRQASPASADGVVYIGGFNGLLYALDADTGTLKWKLETGGPLRARPLVLSGFLSVSRDGKAYPEVLAGSCDGKVYAVTGPDGEPLWEFSAGDRVTTLPLLMGRGVAFGGGDGTLYSVDRLTGRELWSYKTGGRIEYSSPVLVGDLIITGSTDGFLHALDMDTGSLAWSFDTGGVIYSSAQASGRLVAVANNDGEIWWVDAKSGVPAAVYRAGDAVQALSTGPGEDLYAGSRDGYLYCISAGK